MYYHVDVFVGDFEEPKKQSLIIDTGSTMTAFPCANYWDSWGTHINP